MNKNDADTTVPKIEASLEFEDIGIALEERQYRNLTEVLDKFALYQRGIRVRDQRNSRFWYSQTDFVHYLYQLIMILF